MRKEEQRETDNVIKITVTKEAADTLSAIVAEVNEGFDAGKASRQDVASWILSEFRRKLTEAELHRIRQSHFSEGLLLESMYRRMKETGEIPEFLRDALRKQFQTSMDGPKKTRKALTEKSISDGLEENGMAA